MSDNQQEIGAQRLLYGRVVSDKMDKTATVLIERRVQHKLYNKYIRRSTRLKVHDAENSARTGDLVAIRSCRPVSKDKHFTLVDVVDRATDLSAAG
jgi:small subunit ribosomal protein S17